MSARRGKRLPRAPGCWPKGVRRTEKKEHIGFELRLIHNLMEANMKENREQDGFCVTQIQHWIIHYLCRNQDRDVFQRDLEEEFHASRATISSTLQVMERNGLIVRTAVGWDARLKKISLTGKALDFSRRARENVDQMERLLRKGMTREEEETLLRLLKQVRKNLESRYLTEESGDQESEKKEKKEEKEESGKEKVSC